MTLKYESEILFELMKRDGDDTPSDVLPYESELKEKYLKQVEGAYPKLMDYRPEWLNYNLEAHLPADFPVETLSNVTSAAVDNVVPYAYRSAILKGQTLVNKMVNATYRRNPNDLRPNSNMEFINTSGLEKNILPLATSVFEPNKTYTIILFLDEIEDGGLDMTHTLAGKNGTLKIGANKALYTTPSRLDDNNYSHNTQIKCNFKARYMVLDGDYTNVDIPYFTGMQSVKMPVLKVFGKNVVDMVDLAHQLNELDDKINIIDESTWEMTSTDVYHNLKFEYKPIDFKPKTSYTITFEGETIEGRSSLANYIDICYTNGTIKALNQIGINIFTTPSTQTVSHLSFRYGKVGVKETIKNFSIVEGESTTYEPYKSNILTVNEDVTLRGIGDVKDELDCLTGELTQRIGEIVLNGSEDWKQDADTSNQKITICAYVLQLIDTNQTISTDIICERFQPKNIRTIDEEGIYIHGSKGFRLRISIDKLSSPDIDGFKAYLQSNPVTVQYLATESVKTVELNIQDQDGNTLRRIKPIEGTMHIHSDGTPVKPSITMEIPVEAITQNLASFIKEE